MIESGNGGCPGETLVPFVEVRHFQFCMKKYRYHARIVQSFTCDTCFTRALHAADSLLQGAVLDRPRDTPLCLPLVLWVPNGAELTSPRGVSSLKPTRKVFSTACCTATPSHVLGMQSMLKHCDTPYWSGDLHRDHDFAALECGRWSLIHCDFA